MEDFIRTENLEFQYINEDESGGQAISVDVLKGVSMEVKQGEFVALLGHNGSGKSTMAKQFNAMLLPMGGKVEEDVAFGPENLGIEPEEIRCRVDEALKAVDMYEYRTHAPHKLSGGQKQRVAIAGIIAMEPRCIVLDEPTAMLDPRGREEVLSTIRKLNREKGITIVLITHYMDEAVLSDRVIVMDNGEILTQGTPREVFSQVELLKRHKLDVPQATELVHRLKSGGCNIEGTALDEEECAQLLLKLLNENRPQKQGR